MTIIFTTKGKITRQTALQPEIQREIGNNRRKGKEKKWKLQGWVVLKIQFSFPFPNI